MSAPKPAPRNRGGPVDNLPLSAINDQMLAEQQRQPTPVPRPRNRTPNSETIDEEDIYTDNSSPSPVPKISPKKKVSFGEAIPIEPRPRIKATTSPVLTRGLVGAPVSNEQDIAQRERAVMEKEAELRRWEERLRAQQSDHEFTVTEKERELQYREDQLHMKEKELKHREFDLQMSEPLKDGDISEKLAKLASLETELDQKEKELKQREITVSIREGQLVERPMGVDPRGGYNYSSAPPVQLPPPVSYTQPQPVLYQQPQYNIPQPGQALTTQHPYIPQQGVQYPQGQPQAVAGGQYSTSPQPYVQSSPEPPRSPTFQQQPSTSQQLQDYQARQKQVYQQQQPAQTQDPTPPRPSELPPPIYTPTKTKPAVSVDEELAVMLQRDDTDRGQSQIDEDAAFARALQEQEERELNSNLDLDQLIALSVQEDLLNQQVQDASSTAGGALSGGPTDSDTSAQEAIQRRLQLDQERLKADLAREELDRKFAEQLAKDFEEQQQPNVPERNDLDV